jgi:hypothetical protein
LLIIYYHSKIYIGKKGDRVEFISFRSLSSSSTISEYTPVAQIFDPENKGYKQRQVDWNYSNEIKDR